MYAADKKKDDGRQNSEFGGCNNLRSHYQRLGDELCALDSGLSRYGFHRDNDNFRVGVTTVPLEVLESYFEDLLDIDVPEERLFINRRNFGFFFQVLAIVGLAAAFGWGLWSVARGASLIVSFMMTFFMSAPFAILWHFSPRMQLMRRIGFARVVSQEIFADVVASAVTIVTAPVQLFLPFLLVGEPGHLFPVRREKYTIKSDSQCRGIDK